MCAFAVQPNVSISRREIRQLEGEREEMLKNLRLIESRSNQAKDEVNIENLGDLGREKGRDMCWNK